MIEFTRSKASQTQLYEILVNTDELFVPKLSERVDLRQYSEKLSQRAENFEAWDKERLIAVISVYLNDPERKTGFITNVCVLPEYQRMGLAKELLIRCQVFARELGFENIELEVSVQNISARNFYQKNGFVLLGTEGEIDKMRVKVGQN